jgi:hypothetical protein
VNVPRVLNDLGLGRGDGNALVGAEAPRGHKRGFGQEREHEVRDINTLTRKADYLRIRPQEILPGKALGEILGIEEHVHLRVALLEILGRAGGNGGPDHHNLLPGLPRYNPAYPVRKYGGDL